MEAALDDMNSSLAFTIFQKAKEETERREKEEAERREAERIAAEKAEAERLEAERIAAKKTEIKRRIKKIIKFILGTLITLITLPILAGIIYLLFKLFKAHPKGFILISIPSVPLIISIIVSVIKKKIKIFLGTLITLIILPILAVIIYLLVCLFKAHPKNFILISILSVMLIISIVASAMKGRCSKVSVWMISLACSYGFTIFWIWLCRRFLTTNTLSRLLTPEYDIWYGLPEWVKIALSLVTIAGVIIGVKIGSGLWNKILFGGIGFVAGYFSGSLVISIFCISPVNYIVIPVVFFVVACIAAVAVCDDIY